ncbi:Flp1 family type IVb pilin [Carnobacterium gallinarum]|uniref:Flp1 family type IVb pilin n=1 Tax=Carnobacterium gallinarum TaxID=2749 RepID=UPI00054D0D60|nr:Flp1 family type IVb pilin [Carnobacterium gallinarum]
MKNFMLDFWKDEQGLETLEMLLIIAIIVVIAVMFKDKIMTWAQSLLDKGDENITNIVDNK